MRPNQQGSMGQLYKRLRKPETIWRAWAAVQENGRTSKSARTRAEIADFAASAPAHITRLIGQLTRGTFKFAPALGIPFKKKDKKTKRPVVLAPVPNRIVQRALLDVIQDIPEIQQKLSRSRNFGGIEGVGVPEAVVEAFKAARRSGYFIRTDIKSFFDNIPRERALKKIVAHTADPEFDEILIRATTTELSNLASLGRDQELFPLEDIGVAQGSALSPLLCNLLLEDVDAAMNGRGIEMIRYIDDLIIFAPTRARARAALRSMRRMLGELGLDCYDPTENADKAEEGVTEGVIHFLGCEIWRDRVRPSKDSRDRLLGKADDVIFATLSAMAHPLKALQDRKTYIDALTSINNIVRGWGNTYSFCNDDRLMADVDDLVSAKLASFRGRFWRNLEGLSATDKRRLIGVFALLDCKRDKDLRMAVETAALAEQAEAAILA